MDNTERFLRHNAWAARVLLERCRSLTPEQFHQRFEIGPGSLHDTLRHIISVMRRWANRIADRPPGKPLEETPTPHTPDELLVLLDEVNRELQDVVARVAREGRFDEMMRVEFTPECFSRGTAFVHVITHGAHHRAQVLNMLRRLGVTTLPDLEAIEWELRTRAGG
ncbi:MAG TPA: DinB family protein [bacterium]|nr:DinB family protein [bacterium]